jgi:hypothetical protein
MYDGALVLEQPLEILAKKADRIVVGTVTEVTSQKTSSTINTRVKLKASQEIKGRGQQEITLVLEGGAVGDLRLDVGGVPRFVRNERVLLLLDGAASPRIAGGWQGKYALAGSRAYNAEQKSESIKGVAAKLSKALDKSIEIEEDDNEAVSIQFTTYCSPWSTSDVAGFSNSGTWVSTPHADMAVGFEVNTSNAGSGGPTGANFARLSYNSWRNWQVLTNSYPSFAYLGTTTRDGTNHMDGNNTIAWSNLGNSGTLGVNYCVYTSAGRVDSDTLINNNSAYPWDWDDSNGISGGTFSLQAVMEHELGHGLGLGHSNQTCNGSASTPLMCPAVSSGVRKTILTDDSNGAASNYPLSGSAPGAPTDLTATDNGTSFTLNWTASSGSPLAYEIERGNSDCSGGWTPAGTVDSRTYGYNSSGGAIATSPVTSFTDNDFGAGLSGNHCYRLRALGAGGDSAWATQSPEPGGSPSYSAGAEKIQIDAIKLGAEVAVFARTTDNQLWYRETSGGAFGAWTQAGTDIASRPSAILLGQDLYVFYRDTGNHMRSVRRSGNTWSAQSLGGTFQAAPVAALDGDGTLVVSVVTSSGSIWYRAMTGGVWGAWTQIPGTLSGTAQLAIHVYQGDVYLAGVHTSGRTYVNRWDGTADTWTRWTNLGGELTNELTMTSFGGSLYVMGVYPYGSSWYRVYDGAVWSGVWESLGGVLGPRPSAAATSSLLHYFGTQPTGKLYTKRYGGAWSVWTYLGDGLATGPRAISLGGQVYVFATNTEGHLVYRVWNGVSWTTWGDLGGGLAAGD